MSSHALGGAKYVNIGSMSDKLGESESLVLVLETGLVLSVVILQSTLAKWSSDFGPCSPLVPV